MQAHLHWLKNGISALIGVMMYTLAISQATTQSIKSISTHIPMVWNINIFCITCTKLPPHPVA